MIVRTVKCDSGRWFCWLLYWIRSEFYPLRTSRSGPPCATRRIGGVFPMRLYINSEQPRSYREVPTSEGNFGETANFRKPNRFSESSSDGRFSRRTFYRNNRWFRLRLVRLRCFRLVPNADSEARAVSYIIKCYRVTRINAKKKNIENQITY